MVDYGVKQDQTIKVIQKKKDEQYLGHSKK